MEPILPLDGSYVFKILDVYKRQIESGMLSAVRDKKDFFMRPMSVEQALLVGCNNISQVK